MQYELKESVFSNFSKRELLASKGDKIKVIWESGLVIIVELNNGERLSTKINNIKQCK